MMYHRPVTQAGLHPSSPRLATGVKIIVAYKSVKALIEVLLAVALPALILAGAAEHLHSLALALRHHMVSAWSMSLANLLVAVTTDRHLALTAVALALDGLLTFVEAWSLWRGYAWGAWLVVIATSSLIPFEIWELVRERRMGRLLLVIVNAIVAIYLIGRARREWARVG
jgi:uncharacterized membrane protein (DUF2068 family)